MDHALSVCELADVPLLRARFMSELGVAGISGDELGGWALAFTELVNNSVEHGCKNPGDVVSVRWTCDESSIVVVVADPGEAGVSGADFDEATCDGFAETGRGAGLFLIRAWVDDVQVRSDETPGGAARTEIRIERRRESKSDGPQGGRGTEQ
ncbi:MAG: ATP-binding protein [Planctomycetes bacterium]|nr:ATP-binding protein [Planctomycetota bacterium]